MSTDTKLLAAQAANKRLREALEIYSSMSEAMSRPAREALSTPDDTAELDELVADAERYRKLRRTKAAPCDFDLSVDAMKEEKK